MSATTRRDESTRGRTTHAAQLQAEDSTPNKVVPANHLLHGRVVAADGGRKAGREDDAAPAEMEER